MFFPEFLYRLSARDEKVTWLDPRNERIVVILANAQVNADVSVPDSQVLILMAAQVTGLPGLAQNVASNLLQIIPPGQANSMELKRQSAALAANVISDLDWQGEIIVPPDWTVRAAVAYNAGAVNNETRLSLFGILIPVANIQRI